MQRGIDWEKFDSRYGIVETEGKIKAIDTINRKKEKLRCDLETEKDKKKQKSISDEIIKCQVAGLLVNKRKFTKKGENSYPISCMAEKGKVNLEIDVKKINDEMPVTSEAYFIRGIIEYKAKNYIEAEKWFEKSAEKNNLSAFVRLGIMYELGCSSNGKNHEKAKEYYEKAGDEGKIFLSDYDERKENADNKELEKFGYEIAQVVSEGKDFSKLQELIATHVSDENSKLILESNFYHSAKDLQKEIYTLNLLAKKKNIYAMESLALICLDSKQQDYELGFKWAKKAYKEKSIDAKFILSRCCLLGHGCKINIVKAKKYIQEYISYADENEDVQKNLGRAYVIFAKCYDRGNAKLFHLQRARNYYQKAIDCGEKDIMEAVNSVERRIEYIKERMKRCFIIAIIVLFIILIVAVFALKSKKVKDIVSDTYSAVENRNIQYMLYVENAYDIANMALVVPTNVSASSELFSSQGVCYSAVNTIDKDKTTSWQENDEGDGIGEYLEYTLNGDSIKCIGLVLGNAKSDQSYQQNNRPENLRVFVNGKDFELHFDDTNSKKYIVFSEPVELNNFKIEVQSVYAGSKWKDTCISEIEFYSE